MKAHINVSLDSEFLEPLDKTCRKLGIERSEFLCRCALFVMTRREDVLPPMPAAIDAKAKAYAAEKFPAE